MEHVTEVGAHLEEGLRRLAPCEAVVEVRGRGLMWGVELIPEIPVADVVAAGYRHGIVLGSAGHNTLRMVPPPGHRTRRRRPLPGGIAAGHRRRAGLRPGREGSLLMYVVRNAHVAEAAAITTLVNQYAEQGLMLPKSLMEVYEHIREFVVALDEQNRVIACGALRIMGLDLAEVRSLATAREAQGQGAGRKVVEALIENAREIGLGRVFALTYQVGFFEKLGFSIVPKTVFPEKVWVDCKDCAKRFHCDEVAVILYVQAAAGDQPDTDVGRPQSLATQPPQACDTLVP